VLNSVKQKIRSGIPTLGTWVTLGNPAIAEIFSLAGFDWVVVDLEHSTISIDQAGELIRVIDLSGASPLVRLTSNDRNQIKRVMDAGAHGIVVPMINCAADAEMAVAATRYAPQGIRGVGLARAQYYGPGFTKYQDWQKDGPVVIVQIEHVSALDQLENIFSTPGVDGFIIGPYDLSCSMGMPGEFQRPEFLEAMDRILAAGLRSECAPGLHIIEPDPHQLQKAMEDGYRLIAYSVDIRMLDVAARSGIHLHKKA
jgi:2-keto-3-deoxy-L-rhamnonate aldolase RhmA